MNVAPSRTRETIHRCDQGLGSKIPEFTGLHVALIRPEALERSPGGAQIDQLAPLLSPADRGGTDLAIPLDMDVVLRR